MFETFTRRWRAWRLERLAVWRLRTLDDHLLEDMGTTRDGIDEFVRRKTRS